MEAGGRSRARDVVSKLQRSVRGSNFCQIAVHRPNGGTKVVVLVVEDNLTKGASGQAIQCMNLMFDLPETSGLTAPGLLP